MYYHITDSSICPILLAGNEGGLKHVLFMRGENKIDIPADWVESKEFFREAT